MRSKPVSHIVIVGAGFGGVYTYARLHRLLHAKREVRITLVNRTNYFLFTPLLHEVATGGISPENIVQPLRDILNCSCGVFLCADVQNIQFKKKEIHTSRGILSYDMLVLAPGAETNFFGVQGAEKYAFQLKSLPDAIRLKNQIIASVEAASGITDEALLASLLSFVIVGGGATGVELAGEISDFCYGTLSRYYPYARIRDRVRVTLVQSAPELVPQFPVALRELSAQAMKKKHVDVRLNTTVTAIEEHAVILSTGERIETDTPIWVAGVKPVETPCDDASVRDARGCYSTNATLQLTGYKEVFVLGDCVGIHGVPMPQLAQVATQQAAFVAENINRAMRGEPLKTFSYRSSGVLISLGEHYAAGQIGNLIFSGMFCWWLWRTVYLSKLHGFRRKLKVALDWTFDLFLPRDISKID